MVTDACGNDPDQDTRLPACITAKEERTSVQASQETVVWGQEGVETASRSGCMNGWASTHMLEARNG
eukprot:1162046-Pelagomonas_calceolata.AAC.8